MWQKTKRVLCGIGLFSVSLVLFGMFLSAPASAAVGINQQINFQGKLANKSDGTNVANANYSIKFRIYSSTATGIGLACTVPNTCLWEETQPTVAVTDGIFQVDLGSVTSLSGVDFNSNGLYLAVIVGADPEMAPRILFDASPYAFNSASLGGLASSNFVQIAKGVQTDSDITNPSIFVNKTNASGTPNILQLQKAGVDMLTLSNTGVLTLSAGQSYTGAGALTVDSGSGTQLNVGTGANAHNTVLGSTFGASATTIQSGTTANIDLNPGASSDVVVSEGIGSNLQITATGAPTVDQVAITNAGQPAVTAGVNGLSINYVGGNAAVESSGARVDLTPGGLTGGTWNGIRVVANPTGAVSGVNENGIKLDGPTTPGNGTETGIAITTGWDIGVDVQSGGLQLNDMLTDPATPATNNIRVYAKLVSGRSLLSAIGPSGVNFAYQPSLFQQNVFLVTPGNNTTTTSYTATGGSLTTSGTLGSAVTTEAQGVMGNLVTGAVAGNAAGVGNNTTQYYTGSVANGADGFFYFARISLPDALAKYNNTTTGSRLFFGMTDQNFATMVGSDAPAGNYAGIRYSGVADTTGVFKFMTRTGGGSQTVQPTSVTLNVNKTYDIYMYVAPRGTTIYWRIDNLTDGIAPVENSQTLTLPTNNVSMRAMVDIGTLEAVAHNLRMQRLYAESDR